MDELKNWGIGWYAGQVNFTTNIHFGEDSSDEVIIDRTSRLILVEITTKGRMKLYQPKKLKSFILAPYNGGWVGREMRKMAEKRENPLVYWDFVYNEVRKQKKGRIVWECLSDEKAIQLFDAIRHGVQYGDLEPLKATYGYRYDGISLSGFNTVSRLNADGEAVTSRFDINNTKPLLNIIK